MSLLYGFGGSFAMESIRLNTHLSKYSLFSMLSFCVDFGEIFCIVEEDLFLE